MDRKCSNAYSKYILSGLSLYLKYINKAICTINIQYVLSRTSGKCKNTVTIQCKYSRSTQLQATAAATTGPPLPEAWPAPPVSWERWEQQLAGLPLKAPAEPGVWRDQGEERHKGKPPRGPRSPRGWPTSRSQGAGWPRPTARTSPWRVLRASGSGNCLPVLGRVCPTYTEKTDNCTTPSPFIILDFLFS